MRNLGASSINCPLYSHLASIQKHHQMHRTIPFQGVIDPHLKPSPFILLNLIKSAQECELTEDMIFFSAFIQMFRLI